MTPEQSRAARAWLAWSQDDLAKAAKVGQSTVKDFEGAKRAPISATLGAMQAALERAGMSFSFSIENGVKRAYGITFAKPSEKMTEDWTDS